MQDSLLDTFCNKLTQSLISNDLETLTAASFTILNIGDVFVVNLTNERKVEAPTIKELIEKLCKIL